MERVSRGASLRMKIDAQASSFVQKKEIQFGTRVHGIIPRLVRLQGVQRLLERKAFPRCPNPELFVDTPNRDDNMSTMSTSTRKDTLTPDASVAQRVLDALKLSAGEMTNLWATYVSAHPPTGRDLPQLKDALEKRATDAQVGILRRMSDLKVNLLSAEEIADRMGIGSRQGVNKRKGSDLIGVNFANRRGDFYPDFQLDGGTVCPWVKELLGRIPDTWSALAFLTARRESLKGESHLQRILAGTSGAVEAMLAGADEYLR